MLTLITITTAPAVHDSESVPFVPSKRCSPPFVGAAANFSRRSAEAAIHYCIGGWVSASCFTNFGVDDDRFDQGVQATVEHVSGCGSHSGRDCGVQMERTCPF